MFLLILIIKIKMRFYLIYIIIFTINFSSISQVDTVVVSGNQTYIAKVKIEDIQYCHGINIFKIKIDSVLYFNDTIFFKNLKDFTSVKYLIVDDVELKKKRIKINGMYIFALNIGLNSKYFELNKFYLNDIFIIENKVYNYMFRKDEYYYHVKKRYEFLYLILLNRQDLYDKLPNSKKYIKLKIEDNELVKCINEMSL